jgi:hypothetical protein
MLIGPAIGIEKMKPESNPAIDIVIILSIIRSLLSLNKLVEVKSFSYF